MPFPRANHVGHRLMGSQIVEPGKARRLDIHIYIYILCIHTYIHISTYICLFTFVYLLVVIYFVSSSFALYLYGLFACFSYRWRICTCFDILIKTTYYICIYIEFSIKLWVSISCWRMTIDSINDCKNPCLSKIYFLRGCFRYTSGYWNIFQVSHMFYLHVFQP